MSEISDATRRLIAEVERGDAFGIKFELASGADVDHRDEQGLTLLHRAARDNRLTVVKALLEGGARVDGADLAGDTPLHYAVAAEHVDVVDALVEAGASAAVPNRAGQRPIDIGSARVRRHLLPKIFEATGQIPSIK